jgi:hypothetical protein
MIDLHLGDRVASRIDPDRFGTVVGLNRFPNLTEKDWADVEWDTTPLPKQFGRVWSIPVAKLERVK